MLLYYSDDSRKRHLILCAKGETVLSGIQCSCPYWNIENMLIHNRKGCNVLFLTSDWSLAELSAHHTGNQLGSVFYYVLAWKHVYANTKSVISSLQPLWLTYCAGVSPRSCTVRTEMSGLTCGMLGVFHKVNLAKKNRLHTLPHPIIPMRPGLLSSYKRLSHWCYPQLC